MATLTLNARQSRKLDALLTYVPATVQAGSISASDDDDTLAVAVLRTAHKARLASGKMPWAALTPGTSPTIAQAVRNALAGRPVATGKASMVTLATAPASRTDGMHTARKAYCAFRKANGLAPNAKLTAAQKSRALASVNAKAPQAVESAQAVAPQAVAPTLDAATVDAIAEALFAKLRARK